MAYVVAARRRRAPTPWVIRHHDLLDVRIARGRVAPGFIDDTRLWDEGPVGWRDAGVRFALPPGAVSRAALGSWAAPQLSAWFALRREDDDPRPRAGRRA